MRNPFRYGGVVGEAAFCNRERELADVRRAMENGDKLFIHAERRMGKTSLVRRALDGLDPARVRAAYVDLWPTDGEPAFTAATAKALTEAFSTTTDQLLRTAKRLFSRLNPSVTVDAEGRAQVSFGVREGEGLEPRLDEVLRAPAALAAQGRARVVVVFDEFQQLAEYDSDAVERKLRSAVQTHDEVAYLFLGSRKHLIQTMFLDEARPLYRAAGHYPLGPIADDHWLPFVRERFEDADKRIDDARVRTVCRLTEGHPFYTQHLCHALWELCEPGASVTDALIEQGVNLLLERESYAYTTLWDSLSLNQRRFLQGLAHEPAGAKPFSADFLRTYGLGTASNAQRAAEALLVRDVVDRDNGAYVITDRFFRVWIQRMSSP